VLIRDARAKDYDEVGSLLVEAYREYSQALSPENWQKMESGLAKIKNKVDRGTLIVAEQDILVGAVAYYPPGKSNTNIFPPEWASLRLLGVLPAYRGQGIGKLLTTECINRAKEDRASILNAKRGLPSLAAR